MRSASSPAGASRTGSRRRVGASAEIRDRRSRYTELKVCCLSFTISALLNFHYRLEDPVLRTEINRGTRRRFSARLGAKLQCRSQPGQYGQRRLFGPLAAVARSSHARGASLLAWTCGNQFVRPSQQDVGGIIERLRKSNTTRVSVVKVKIRLEEFAFLIRAPEIGSRRPVLPFHAQAR